MLTDRVALVTGASSGIGAGLARMPAAEGTRVALAARRAAELERVAEQIRAEGGTAICVVTDLTDDRSIADLLATTRARLGPVDVLVNNAAQAIWKSLEDTSTAEWDRLFAVNLRAAALLCAGVLPDMQARGYGRIVNIGSEAGVAIVPGLAAYCISKHALGTLTEVIQDANQDRGIKAWVICPGFVDTDMGQVVPGADRADFLTVDEVTDLVRYLLNTADNVKLGPQILVRTMRNPMHDGEHGEPANNTVPGRSDRASVVRSDMTTVIRAGGTAFRAAAAPPSRSVPGGRVRRGVR
jgi:short-subunit dehydrogenase